MQPKPSLDALSSYDPKYRAETNFRRQGKSEAERYYKKDYWGTPTPVSEVVIYTNTQHIAFAQAIRSLCDANPVAVKNREGRKKLKARGAAVHFAETGNPNSAFAQAIYGGLPKQQLRAIEALIFG